MQRTKSTYSIEDIEYIDFFVINHLEALFKKELKQEHFGRLFRHQIYIELLERIENLQLHTTKQRYDTLLTKKSYLLKCFASKHIAFS